MRWRRAPSGVVVLVAVLATAYVADAETPAWVRDVVCPITWPLVGDFPLPEGIAVQQLLADFRPEVADRSNSNPWTISEELRSNPLLPRASWGGVQYDFAWLTPGPRWEFWDRYYGTAWEPTEDCGVAVASNGELVVATYDGRSPIAQICHNCPRLHDLHKSTLLRTARNPECALVRQDNIGVPSGVHRDNGGWCKWCMAGYKRRLARRFAPQQLRGLGVADLASFDPAEYLRSRLAGGAQSLIEDPLVREYVRFMYKSNLEAWRDEVRAVHEIRPNLPVSGNQVGAWLFPYPEVLLSDVSDVIGLEHGNRAYPDSPNAIHYALVLAAGRHDKPAWVFSAGFIEQLRRVDESLVFLAECYANGAVPYYWLSAELPRETYDALAHYARFVRTHKRLVTRAYAADARVALVYSLPSFLPKFCGTLPPLWFCGAAVRQMNHLRGFARFLERNHIPYNVEVFGDEEFWPDGDLARRLARYAVVVCPNAEAMSSLQVEALQAFRERGKVVVASGDLATRDEQFVPRGGPLPPGIAPGGARGQLIRVGAAPVTYLTTSVPNGIGGASQNVTLNQTAARPLVARAWSKAQDVKGAPNAWRYGVSVQGQYADGSPLAVHSVQFATGTHDWQSAELVVPAPKPIASAKVQLFLRHTSGTAWFDDVSLVEQGSETNLLANAGFEDGTVTEAEDWTSGQPEGARPDYLRSLDQSHSGMASISLRLAPPVLDPGSERTLAQAFRRALGLDDAGIRTDAPATVFIRPVRRGNSVIVHLLNTDYDAARERITPARAFRLAVRLPRGRQVAEGDVTLARADDLGPDVSLSHELDDEWLGVAIPRLHIWSILHFTVERK